MGAQYALCEQEGFRQCCGGLRVYVRDQIFEIIFEGSVFKLDESHGSVVTFVIDLLAVAAWQTFRCSAFVNVRLFEYLLNDWTVISLIHFDRIVIVI